jgi:monooxygenase
MSLWSSPNQRGWATLPFCNDIGLAHDQLVSAVATDAPIHGQGKIDPVIVDLHTGRPLVEPEPAPTGNTSSIFFRANRNRIRHYLMKDLDVTYEMNLIAIEPGISADIVKATFSSGDTVEGSLIVGADGVHSTVRSLMLPHVQPKVIKSAIASGARTLSRTESDRIFAPVLKGSNALLMAGERLRLGLTVVNITFEAVDVFWAFIRPANGDKDPLFVINQDPKGALRLPQRMIEEVSQIGQLAEPYAQLLDPKKMRSDEMFNWCMRAVSISSSDLDTLMKRNITLIGDSAHAMPFFAGEGGNHALLDGVELGRELRKAKNRPAEAVAVFYEDAIPRWEEAVDGSIKGLSRLALPLNVWRKMGEEGKPSKTTKQ